jgi:protein disulfide-isomerase A6
MEKFRWLRGFLVGTSVALLLLLLRESQPVEALYGPSSDVLLLTPSTFKSKVLNSDGIVLVEFFAPWCGHCQALTPIWEKTAAILKGFVTVAALDADAHKSLAQEYGIQGFPTIKVFTPGKPPIAYQGARDAKPIAEFAIQQLKTIVKDRLNGKTGSNKKSSSSSSSSSVELTSNNFDDIVLKSKDPWLVEFYAPWCGHCKKLGPEWKKAANNLKGKVNMGQVNCDSEKSLMSRFNVQGFPTILVFGSDKESPVPYEGARTASAIESFALEQLETNVSPPEVVELTSQDVLETKCASSAICFVSFLPDILDTRAEGRNSYLEQLMSVAEKFKRSPYSYVWAAAGKQPALERAVGVGGYGYPAFIALNIKKGVYAPLRSAFELEHLVDFVKDAGRGGKGNLPLVSVPVLEKTEPWDGKDGEILEEDEFSLDELMGNEDDDKKEDL